MPLFSRRLLGGLLLLASCLTPPPALARTTLDDPIATVFIYPVGNPNVAPTWDPTNGNGYFITQMFNDSCDPSLGQGYYAYGLYYCGHTGVDLATQGADSTVHATAAGVVTEAQEDGGYGVTVRIRHLLANGSVVYSQYEHMQYGSLQVYAGEVVSQGQALGLVGATGFALGAHLHFELKTIDAGGPGYTFGNQSEIAPFFDPLAFVAAHSLQPYVLITPSGRAIPEWPAESEMVLNQFLRQYKHFVEVASAHGLYVRTGPGTRNDAIGVALSGAKLGFLKAHGDWLYVALPQNVRGWVNKSWVAGYEAWGTPWPPRGPVAFVDVIGLNIHSAPGQNHTVLGACYQGDVVVLGKSTANWTQVRTREGTRGWVVSRYLLRPGHLRAIGGGQTILAVAPVLNVRAGPGVSYPLTGRVFRGTSMQLERLTPHWAAVILPGGTAGWVARPYTSLAAAQAHVRGRPAAAKSPRAEPAVIIRVSVSVINIHDAPGDRHKVIARAMEGAPLQVLGTTSHWAHIALPATSIQGWVLRKLTRSNSVTRPRIPLQKRAH